jgi:hypothetical protein
MLFKTSKELKGTQMLCKETLDLSDTMSCFEVMHIKMDARMQRKEVTTPRDIPKTVDLSNQQRLALVQELLR